MSAAVIPFRARAADGKAALRARVAATLETTLAVVDELVAMLDRLDGDPDLEDGGEAEPPSSPRRATIENPRSPPEAGRA